MIKAQSTGKKFNNYEGGFTTLEILIAFTILILFISAVILVVFGNQSIAIDSSISLEAISKAQKLLEETRAASVSDFNLVNPSIATETSGPIIFTKTLDVVQKDFFTKEVTSTVSWTSSGKTLSTIFTTLLTNRDSSDTCSSVPTGDWKNPQFTNYEFGKDLIGDTTNIFPVSSMDVHKGKMFVAINNSTSPTLPTFFEFNLTNGTSPTLTASLDNSPTVSAGISAVTISGNYAYVANSYASSASACVENNNCAQLQIIDVSSPASPTVVRNFKISATTSSGKLAAGASIFYKNGYVYLGLAKASGSGSEFNIIDVSDPINPVYKGGYNVGAQVNSIVVKNNYAYIATPNAENMTTLNLSNPANPTRVGGYSPSGGSSGESVYTIGSTAYLGRTFGTNEFYILNTASPAAVSSIANKDIGTGNKTSINSIIVRDYLAFMITNEKFEIWNISYPNNIFPWTVNNLATEFQTLIGTVGTAMDCEGNIMYVGSVPTATDNKGFISIITAN